MIDQQTGGVFSAEVGVPLEYARRGIDTVAGYQNEVQRELSDRQLAAQQDIASKQDAFNREQFQYQKDLDTRQQTQAQEQSARQTAYDTGRSQLLSEGQNQIEQAFSRFSPEYFDTYAKDYVAKGKDEVDYQRQLADKEVMFDMARRGLTGSQALANKFGLLTETQGRTMANIANEAENAANTQRSNVLATKGNLLGQVQNAEAIGSPIAGGDMGAVGTQLQTQRNAISGISNQAGDVASKINPVPQVSSLGSIFSGVLNPIGSYLSGVQANRILGAGRFRADSPF